jgi:hypothetical protein
MHNHLHFGAKSQSSHVSVFKKLVYFTTVIEATK